MAINKIPVKAFTAGDLALDTFTATAGQTAVTLSVASTSNSVIVTVNDVLQVPPTDYSVNGTTLTFTSALALNDSVVVRIVSRPSTFGAVEDGAISSAKLAADAIQTKLGYTPVSPTQLNDQITSSLTTKANVSDVTTVSSAITAFYTKGDPTFTENFSIDNPNAYGTADSDFFGGAIAISGNLAIISARLEDEAGGTNSGKAYIFNITTNTLTQTLSNPNAYGTIADDYFGSSVAISGNYAAVAAFYEDDAGGTNSGKVYIFNATTGSLIATLNNANSAGTTANDFFGSTLASSGNYLFVSASGERYAEGAGTNCGVIYVYDITNGTYLYKITNPNAYGTADGDNFGYTLAAYGSKLVASAMHEDDATATSSGKAYVFNISSGSASLLYTFNNPNPVLTATNDYFGRAVAISSTKVAIGAREAYSVSYTASGYVYVYDLSTGNLAYSIANPNAYATPSNDQFGEAIAISGDLLVVGARGETDATSDSYVGKVYTFNLATGALLSTISDPNKYNTPHSDTYGTLIVADGYNVLITASSEGAASGSGVVYKYTSASPTTLTASNFISTGTGAITLPVGSTAQRPSVPSTGMIRMNSTTGYPEWYDISTSTWVKFPFESYFSADALIVAGGGGSGASSSYVQTGVGNGGGGGGAGGLLLQSINFVPGTSYTITVGAGGAAGTANVIGGSGGNSRIGSFTAAIGGGGGGTGWNYGPSAGGSGGGNGGASSGLPLGGLGTSGQGYRGGNRTYGGASGCGGGGSSGPGTDFTSNANYGAGTAGGAGTVNTYSGSSVTYAAGGNGGAYNSGSSSYGGTNATSNTGNGGIGGAGSDSAGGWYTGGAGGSGVVIIRYLGLQRATGGTVTSSNGYTIHTFTTSGTFTA